MSGNQFKRLKCLCDQQFKDNSPENEWTDYSNDSFDRFGDDLCEFLLSYLSFEDSFRFECVSKQFQRLIFNKQKELILDNKLKKKMEEIDVFGKKYISVQRVTQILKKCSNIQRITVLINIKSMDGLLSLITTYCRHLNGFSFEFEMNTNNKNMNSIEEFCHRFGPQMKSLRIWGKLTDFKIYLLNSCHNLESIHLSDVTNIYRNFFETDQSFPKGLKSFSLSYESNTAEDIEKLVKYNKNTLKSIYVYFFGDVSIVSINKLLNQLSNLWKLKKISLIFTKEIDGTVFKNLKKIGTNCPNISGLSIRFIDFNYSVKKYIQQLLVFINSLRQLKRLTITTLPYPYSSICLKSRDLIECKQLTHLEINSYDILITDEFFEDIEKYLPKLQSIEAKGYLTNNGLESMSKLSDLTKINLTSNDKDLQITKPYVESLLFNCLKLRYIYLWHKKHTIVLNELEIQELKQLLDNAEIKAYKNSYSTINYKKFMYLPFN